MGPCCVAALSMRGQACFAQSSFTCGASFLVEVFEQCGPAGSKGVSRLGVSVRRGDKLLTAYYLPGHPAQRPPPTNTAYTKSFASQKLLSADRGQPHNTSTPCLTALLKLPAGLLTHYYMQGGTHCAKLSPKTHGAHARVLCMQGLSPHADRSRTRWAHLLS